jgi:hypothetical protein
VDKLTKFAILVPTQTNINESETAQLIFKHVISRFGIPKQFISDRDPRWSNNFWKEMCQLLGSKRALTTAHHPQADGQTEVMNQILEIALRCYVNSERDDWDKYLDAFSLAYNTTPHSATTYSPAFLLFGYHPRVAGTRLEPNLESVNREADKAQPQLGKSASHDIANEISEQFNAFRSHAVDCLLVSQASLLRNFNSGRRVSQFQPGDQVLLNPHTLKMLRDIRGRGQKLLMRYDGPFEISEQLGPNTYRLRMPASYRMHPVFNSEHLEPYKGNTTPVCNRPTKRINRDDFDIKIEYEVERIIAQKVVIQRGKKVMLFRVRWKGFGESEDTWEPKINLKNAPEALKLWQNQQR